ncbi:MAG TPA: aminoacyl--tRNA ligase-related protein [Candidatus Paceibacterota bacterium]|nr:aminoacyl--tRNA ligase-related protein [Candidatus Paceibacterota bacterium]
MLQSQLFTRTRREAPKDEVSKNAELLVRAGFVHKEMAGVYSYLPLGLRVLNKITQVVREEINAIGGQEVVMTALQDPELWQKTGRWDDAVVDNWFKTKLKNDTELGLGLTHEEEITAIMTEHITSYRDLPVYAYQFQTKFRNEARAKSGIMRGREFLMKDLYSFNANQEDLDAFYEKAKAAYHKIYDRLGLGDRTYLTFAAGGIFSKYSHEFQTVSEAGEDTIYVSKERGIAINEEVYTDEVLSDLGLAKADLVEKKSIEVGNIFKLGTKFSEPLGLSYLDEKGEKHPVVMGSYGIGISRLMGTVVEALSDEKGMVWPKSIAPMVVHVVELGRDKNEQVHSEAKALHDRLEKQGIEILLDDRSLSAGEKFADSDLIGIPYRVVVSERTLQSGTLELKDRATGETDMLTEAELVNLCANA